MTTKRQEETGPLLISGDAHGIACAVGYLKSAQPVAFPTETIYGLGACASDPAGIAALYTLKGRPRFNPLIVHVNTREQAENFARFDARARLIADAFWPGPLTLVLPLVPDQTAVHALATAGLETVAVRVPAHKMAQDLIAATGPLVAPSANKSGTLSPTTPLHVATSFGPDAPPILAGGPTRAGVESTILDLSVDPAVILRAGSITPDDLAPLLGYTPTVVHDILDENGRPKSPGLLLRHYAPRTKIRLHAVDVCPGEAVLAFGPARFLGMRMDCPPPERGRCRSVSEGEGGDPSVSGLVTPSDPALLDHLPLSGGGYARDVIAPDRFRNLSETGDLVEAAAHLFKMLHELDATNATCIAVMDIPNVGLGLAINDRLAHAAAAS